MFNKELVKVLEMDVLLLELEESLEINREVKNDSNTIQE
jgi:hypothetical protein